MKRLLALATLSGILFFVSACDKDSETKKPVENEVEQVSDTVSLSDDATVTVAEDATKTGD